MIFDSLQPAPPDPILGLTEAFLQDPNPEKINLTVGIYKDESGKTPILRAVKAAEQRLLAEEPTKSYLGIDGLASYDEKVKQLLFGDALLDEFGPRSATLQTPGGTGALRLAADLIRRQFPQSRIWVSNPTWNNHPKVFEAAGLEVKTYAYLDADGRELHFDALLEALQAIPSGDVICLHACCHNPSGVDPSAEQWLEIGRVVRERGIIPLVDFAYQGFGDGLDEDAAGLRSLLSGHPQLPPGEVLVCSSYSKNFGLYCERVGALTIVTTKPAAAEAALSHAKTCARANYSNPPKHGAAIVATILSDPELTQQWKQELDEMRTRINTTRTRFAETMKQVGAKRDFDFITRQRGMFSFSGLTPVQVDQLRAEFAIYIVGSGRINVAGMNDRNLETLCRAIAKVVNE